MCSYSTGFKHHIFLSISAIAKCIRNILHVVCNENIMMDMESSPFLFEGNLSRFKLRLTRRTTARPRHFQKCIGLSAVRRDLVQSRVSSPPESSDKENPQPSTPEETDHSGATGTHLTVVQPESHVLLLDAEPLGQVEVDVFDGGHAAEAPGVGQHPLEGGVG